MIKKLSVRLEAVASFVPQGAFLADVGADHAYLPLFLLEKNKIEGAQAIENKKGPYEHMLHSIAESPYRDLISPSFSDGISSLNPKVNCLSLCGMGGLLSCEILEAHKENLSNVQTIVMDPHRDLAAVRKRVAALGYRLSDETMVFEEGIFYAILKWEKGQLLIPYKEVELVYGPILLQKRGKVFEDYLLFQKKTLEKILGESLSKEARINLLKRLETLEEALQRDSK